MCGATNILRLASLIALQTMTTNHMGVVSLWVVYPSTLADYLQLKADTYVKLQAILEVLAVHMRKPRLLVLLLLLEERRTVCGEGCSSRKVGDVIEGVQSVLPPTLIKLLRQVEHEGDNVLLETVLITLQHSSELSQDQ